MVVQLSSYPFVVMGRLDMSRKYIEQMGKGSQCLFMIFILIIFPLCFTFPPADTKKYIILVLVWKEIQGVIVKSVFILFFFCYLSFLLSWFRYRPYIFPVTVDYGLWSMSYVLIKILLPLDSIDLSITLELSIFPVTLCEWHTRTSHSNTFSW